MVSSKFKIIELITAYEANSALSKSWLTGNSPALIILLASEILWVEYLRKTLKIS